MRQTSRIAPPQTSGSILPKLPGAGTKFVGGEARDLRSLPPNASRKALVVFTMYIFLKKIKKFQSLLTAERI